jgi:hypothetical protein
MSADSRLEPGALDAGFEEADLLAHLADAVLDYVADGRHPHHAAGVPYGQHRLDGAVALVDGSDRVGRTRLLRNNFKALASVSSGAKPMISLCRGLGPGNS